MLTDQRQLNKSTFSGLRFRGPVFMYVEIDVVQFETMMALCTKKQLLLYASK